MPLIIELERAYSDAINDPKFRDEIKQFSKDYIGRVPLLFCRKINKLSPGAKVYFKRMNLITPVVIK